MLIILSSPGRNSIALLVLLAMLHFPVPAYSGDPWKNWQNPNVVENALVGHIWSASQNRYVSPSHMIKKLMQAKYVLAGEVHDNRDHHMLQAWIIDKIVQSGNGAKPAIVMEMIRSDKRIMLAEYMGAPEANSAGLASILDWETSGWPQWSYYEPIADVVFKHGLNLFAGDPARALIRDVAKNGYSEISTDDISRLGIGNSLSKQLAQALDNDIIDSHCNLLPAAMIAPMVKVQRFRDASLARAMVDIKGNQEANVKAILIAGNGHIRSDRAVPWYLDHQDPATISLSIMMVEVGKSDDTIRDLLELAPDGTPLADYFWFTPGAERQDQCEKLRKRFGDKG